MFLRKKEKNERMHLNHFAVEMRIDQGSKIAKQIKMLQMTDDDLKFLKAFQPYVEENIEAIVDYFYDAIGMEPSLTKIIDDNSSVERLKKTLKKHIREMFSGQIDEQFFLKRQRIAQVHVHIGLPTKYYIGAFQNLFINLMEIVEQEVEHPKDQFATLRAVSKILNFEQQIVLEEFENVVQQTKIKHEEQKEYISCQIVEATENLVAVADQTSAAVSQLHEQSEGVVNYAEQALQISSNATSCANDGNDQINRSLQQMEKIIQSVDEIALDIHELVTISREMEGIIAIVTSIADQTNLLSLNAAIEAARAGEAGKGFSVVAGEVRNLSEQTKLSTKNVATLLQSSNIQTEKLLSSMQRIQSAVALGEQSLSETAQRFTQILVAMEEQQQKNSLVGREVHTIGQVIDDLGAAFNEVSHSVDSLATVAKELV
ncbi:globin-coupled sensor protein [Metasolibacillus sp. FSL H7-0170]|uniref:globin-coupled sensor protein n=1 Tax=Metasolibacillus TaxID=2703677 RepID=UPI000825A12B|nr:globin-coupled sensor protein [Metasolibacillus fluoroglycofenilyticus]